MDENEYRKQVLEGHRTEAIQRDWLLITGSAAIFLGLLEMYSRLPRLVESSKMFLAGSLASLAMCMISVLLAKSSSVWYMTSLLDTKARPGSRSRREWLNRLLNVVSSLAFILGVAFAVIYGIQNIDAEDYGRQKACAEHGRESPRARKDRLVDPATAPASGNPSKATSATATPSASPPATSSNKKD